MIAGKRSPGTICPMHARSKPNDQETRVNRSKRRHGSAVIIRITTIDVVQKTREARTGATVLVKYRSVHLSVLHMANHSPAKASGANQPSAGNQFFKFLLDLFLIVRL